MSCSRVPPRRSRPRVGKKEFEAEEFENRQYKMRNIKNCPKSKSERSLSEPEERFFVLLFKPLPSFKLPSLRQLPSSKPSIRRQQGSEE